LIIKDGCPETHKHRSAAAAKRSVDMDQEKEIVFFDELGFGWLLDAATLRKLEAKESTDNIIIQQSLAELFRNRKIL
jgi:hypothetical protein